MKHNAELLYRKQALRKMIAVANHLARFDNETADAQRGRWLQIRGLSSLRDYVAIN